MDEKTPHIHATVVPIVTGERRKHNKKGKKKYRTKPTNLPRLCADDLMARTRLKSYHDTYAAQMSPFGLKRGINGSAAEHISTRQYYNQLIGSHDKLKADVADLEKKKQELIERERELQRSHNFMIEEFLKIHSEILLKEEELAGLYQQAVTARQRTHPDNSNDELTLLKYIYSDLEKVVEVAWFCLELGIPLKSIPELVQQKTIKFSGELFSHEFGRSYRADKVEIGLKQAVDFDGLTVTLDGIDHVGWFRTKRNEELPGPTIKRNKGMKMG